MNRQVTRFSSTALSKIGGDADSSSNAQAPKRRGKISRAPSPKVKANGGLPAKMSAAVGCTIAAQKESAIASTSRWKCMVAFGLPVVPEVNASMQTSSAAVSTGMWTLEASATNCSRSSGSAPPNTSVSPAKLATPDHSSTNRWSTNANCTCAMSTIFSSSPVRNSGIVVTTTAPIRTTASQVTASHGLLGPRRSTRFPGTTPSATKTLAVRCTRSASSS